MAQTKGSSQTKTPTSNSGSRSAAVPARRDPKPNLSPHPSASLDRHRRLCAICRHTDRDSIEQDFLHWMGPCEIASHYDLPDRFTVYRHAHATGLIALRKRNLRSALEYVIEGAEAIQPTASGLVCAMRAYTRITDDGEWLDSPKRVIFSHETVLKVVPPYPSQPMHDAPLVLNPPQADEGSEPLETELSDQSLPSNVQLPAPGLEDSPETQVCLAPPQPADAVDAMDASPINPTDESGPTEQAPLADSVEFVRTFTSLARKVARVSARCLAEAGATESGDDN